MNLISKRKYKDEYPLNTINKIRNILNEMGILTIESMWAHSADNFFSVTVTIVNSTLSTNGKGTTYEYALASAYGELLERLQNQAPFRLSNDLSQETIEYKDFFYAPDEKKLNESDILNSKDEWISKKFSKLNTSINKKELLSKWKQISYEQIPCDFIGVPFYNLNSKKESYIPIKMLSKMYMSNGMCAGNTDEEALVQGISEILERHVNKQVIMGKLNLPTIPREFLKNYPKIYDMISQIESNGNFEIILKDCNLNQGFPVVGVIFIDKDSQSYFIKFGSHPTFEIAAERTLTELLQGQDIRKMKGTWEFSYKSYTQNNHNNLINILVNGSGEYPVEFFNSKENLQFEPPVDTTQMNNKEMLNYLINIIKESGNDIYIRNVSFLGFPSFHVIIPNLSEIEEIDDICQLEDYSQFIKIKKAIRNLLILDNNQLTELADLIGQRNLGFETPVMEFLNISTCKDFPWYYANFDLLIVAIYCKTGNYYGACEKIENLLILLKSNSFNPETITYYKCLRDYLAAKADNLSINQIIEILSGFYHDNMIRGIISEIDDSEKIFKNNFSINCFNCSNCNLKISCPYIETERVYKLIKEKYSDNQICNNY